MKHGWGRIIASLCVALIGLAALLGLEYALMRLWPLTAAFTVLSFIAFGLIVAGMIVGLDKVDTVLGKSNGSAPPLIVVESSKATTVAGVGGQGD